MILLTRLNGATIGVNADLIERIDSTPDTVITLVDGKKYLVTESTDEVVERIVHFRARVLAADDECAAFPGGRPATAAEVPCGRSAPAAGRAEGVAAGQSVGGRAGHGAAPPGAARPLRLVSARDEDR
jgi:flagellar protein FlbD